MDQSAESSIVVTEQNVDVTNGLFLKKKKIYLAALGLGCCMGDLVP